MKKLINHLLSIIILLLPLYACETEVQKEDTTTLSVANGTLVVAATDTEASFDIESNASWTAICHSDRVTSYTESGSGNAPLKVSFLANEDTEAEQAISIAVIAGKKSLSLQIFQTRKGVVIADPTLEFNASAEVSAETTSYTLPIQSNSIWGVYSDAAWVTSYTQMGEGDGNLVINFEQYKKRKADRTATFVISAQSITRTFTLTQLKTDKVEIVDTKIAPFLAEEVDEDVVYRVTGQITAADGAAVTIADYGGSVSVASVLASAGGAPVDFATLGLAAGDVVTLVGTRAVNGTEPTIGEAYLESSHKVVAVTVSEFLAAADGTDTWYMVSGQVSGITDTMNGVMTMTDPLDNTKSISVNGVLTGVKAEILACDYLILSCVERTDDRVFTTIDKLIEILGQ